MEEFEAIPKKWGNSIRIKIPLEIVKKANIKSGKKINIIVMKNPNK